MKINLKKEDENAVIPAYSRDGDAGMDLVAVSKTIVNEKDHGYIEYDTGIAIELPENYVCFVFPRGSVSHTGLILANAVGVVDSNYGERVAQIIILPYPTIEFNEVNELSETNRQDKAFGSSGK